MQTAITLLFGSAADAQLPNLGASGAIAAVLGAYIVLYPHSRIFALAGWIPVRVKAWFFLGFWFLFQLFEGNFALVHPDKTGDSHVAFFAHVGGFVFGVLVAIILTLSGRITSGVDNRRGRREERPTTTTARCRVCQHMQVVPRIQPAFVCEQCGAKLKRRTHSSVVHPL